MMCRVIVFDFDGVLYREGDVRGLGIALVAEALSRGFRVYIVSGRRVRDLPLVKSILREAGVPPGRLSGIMLRDRGSEAWFKLSAYSSIVDSEGCILEIHDDNAEALWPARRIVSGGLVLHYNGYCSVIYGSTVFEACRE